VNGFCIRLDRTPRSGAGPDAHRVQERAQTGHPAYTGGTALSAVPYLPQGWIPKHAAWAFAKCPAQGEAMSKSPVSSTVQPYDG